MDLQGIKIVSACCAAPMTVNQDNSVTRYYICTKCKEACDPKFTKEEKKSVAQ